MAKRVFIIHGSGSSPRGNWFPWLKEKLEETGNEVYVPEFPIGNKQNLSSWRLVFDKYVDLLGSNTIMVGHSLAPAFIFDLLERNKTCISSSFLVAPFVEPLGLSLDKVNKTFVDKEFDWKTIKGRCRHFYVYASDNDPYVPFEKSKLVANKLEAKLIMVKNGKHMNGEAGYTKFELLMSDIKKEL